MHDKDLELPCRFDCVEKVGAIASYKATLDTKKSHPITINKLLKQLESGRPFDGTLWYRKWSWNNWSDLTGKKNTLKKPEGNSKMHLEKMGEWNLTI